MPYKDPHCKAAIESSHRRHKKWYDKRSNEYRLRRNASQMDYHYRLGYEHVQKRRLEVLTHYGGTPLKCQCCGESNIEFLTIDHINGGGNQQRKHIRSKNGKTINFYKWLVDNNFPEGYRVLCYNCNCSLGHYGYCPHKIVSENRKL
jgi:hypothetical protein